MTYFEGFIAPVPEANKDAYRKHANDFAPIAREIGVHRSVEAWANDVPDGKVTDFKKAVAAKPSFFPTSNTPLKPRATRRTRNS